MARADDPPGEPTVGAPRSAVTRVAAEGIATALTELERRDAPLPPLARASLVAGRYEIEALLGRGGFGEVYRVADLREGRRTLALKLHRVRDANRIGAAALESEFALLSSLSHPNLAAVYDFGYAGEDIAFFTQELVSGDRLDRARLDIRSPRVVSLLAQLCRALDYLHSRGILHRDIKPSNVIVDAASEHLTLLDFGVARALRAGLDEMLVGTTGYMAPESIAGGPVDARSDLYSLGVTLYQLAAGRLPFEGSASEVVWGHVSAPPPSLDVSAIGPDLANVVMRLLAKQPGERFASATELLAALAAATGVDVDLETRDTLASYVLSARFVGRSKELAALVDEVVAPPAPIGRVVVTVGEAGTGKSRLLREARQRVQLARRSWLWVDAQRADGLGSIVQEIARAVLTPDIAARLYEEDRVELARVLPELKRPGERLGIAVSPERADARRTEALARAIALRFRGRPGALAIEDLHWTSVEVAALLATLVETSRAQAAQCTFLVTSRPGDVLDAFLAGVDAKRVECSTLDPEESSELVESMFGDRGLLAGTSLGRALATSPHAALWVQESLRLAIETGSIARARGVWNVTRDIASLDLSRVLRERVAGLRDAEVGVAVALAVSDRAVSLRELAAVCGRRVQDIAVPLQELIRSGIVEDRRDASGAMIVAMHDRFVDVVLDIAPEPARMTAHRRAARWLRRAKSWSSVARAARHLEQAGDADDAISCYEDAIAAAESSGRPDLAVRLADAAIAFAAERTAGRRAPLRLIFTKHDLARKGGLAEIAESAVAQLAARRAGASREERVEIALRVAIAEQRGGRAARARRRVRAAIEEARALGMHRTECELVLTAAQIEEVFGALERALETYELAAQLASKRREPAMAARGWLGAAYVAIYLGRNDEAAPHATRAVRAARASRDPAVESEALRQLGNVVRERGEVARSIAIYRRAVRAARRCGSPEHEAKALNNVGVAAQWLGRVGECLEAHERAAMLKERAGDAASIAATRSNLGAMLVGLGRKSEARALIEPLLDVARENEPIILATARANLGDLLALEGKLDEAIDLYSDAYEMAARRELVHASSQPLTGLARAFVMRGSADDLARAETYLRALARVAKQESAAESPARYHSSLAMLADARGERERAAREALRALEKRGFAKWFWGTFASMQELEWIAAIMLYRAGRRPEARRALARARRRVDGLMLRVGDARARAALMDAYPFHAAIVSGSFDMPPGWTWSPSR